MIRRRNLRTRSIKMLILDEADEMLNKGEHVGFYYLFIYFYFWAMPPIHILLRKFKQNYRFLFCDFMCMHLFTFCCGENVADIYRAFLVF